MIPGPGDGPGRLGVADAEREAQLLSRVVETISAGLDLDRILQGVAQLVTETTETDVCFVHLLDERGRKLQLRGATPPFDTMVGSVELALGEGVAGWVADHGQPAVIVDNKTADPRYRYIPALRGEEFTSMLSVPVVTPMGHLVGVLNVHTRLRREFTAADVELLRTVAGLVAGAIENARLHRRLAEREEALERFAERMVEWQEHERRRMAGEIHDGISQRIVSLFFHLSAAADAIPGSPAGCGRAGGPGAGTGRGRPGRDPVGDRRAASPGAGRPRPGRQPGKPGPRVPPAGRAGGRGPAQHGRARGDRGVPDRPGSAAERGQARRRPDDPGPAVPAEGPGRAGGHRRRHRLRRWPTTPAAGAPGGPTGFGLSGMRERAELLGGRLDLASTPGRGTTVRLAIPYLPAAQSPG